jgi:hypothetical protein
MSKPKWLLHVTPYLLRKDVVYRTIFLVRKDPLSRFWAGCSLVLQYG